MERWKKKGFKAVFSIAAMSLAFAAAGSFAGGKAAWAAEQTVRQAETRDAGEKKKSGIGRLYLIFDSDLGIAADGRSASVTPDPDRSNSEKYYVDDVQVVNDDTEDFGRMNLPELEVTLVSEDMDRWYFSGSGAGSFKLSLSEESKSRYDKVEFVSASREDDDTTLTLRVRLVFDEESAPMRRAETPVISVGKNPSAGPGVSEETESAEAFGWDADQRGTAVWEKTDGAGYYQIQLLRDGAEADIMRSVYWTSYDFSEKMTQPGAYSFRVRSVDAVTHEKSQWLQSGTLTVGS